ncbi:MAG TPA: thioesterase family protein [Acidobacteriaceae bacterium]|jgi:acyl-CoA thioesterase FadM|nr:thioesterase family protein [Acidobacteriaceae bacterium]
MAHFNSFVRIPLVVLRQAIRPLPALGVLETDTLKMRVWPNDVDFNLHLNNARYLSVMDYGRIRQLARMGLLMHMFKQRWTPVVGGVWITYRRSLPLWARYQLATRLVCWDERWFYFEQIFTGDAGLVAVGWVKGALLDRGTAIEPQRVVDLAGVGIVSPPLPEAIQMLNGLTREKLQSAAS